MGLKNLLKRCLKFSNSGKKLKSSCSNSKLELNVDVSAFCVVLVLAATGLAAGGGPWVRQKQLVHNIFYKFEDRRKHAKNIAADGAQTHIS